MNVYKTMHDALRLYNGAYICYNTIIVLLRQLYKILTMLIVSYMRIHLQELNWSTLVEANNLGVIFRSHGTAELD